MAKKSFLLYISFMLGIFLLIALFFPLAMAPLFLILERITPRYMGFISMLAPLVSTFFLALVGISNGWDSPANISIPWVPILGINLSFLVDGLSLFFGFLVTVMGVLVCLYAQAMMTHRKKHMGKFYSFLLFFMSMMLATVFSDNFILLFVFWELTGVASFILIGFYFEEQRAVEGARMALLVTSLTSLSLLVGLILLGFFADTYSWSSIVREIDRLRTVPLWLNLSFLFILVGIFGKSAQLPFFFWLPRAMVAPTAVSAYLHAATMVKLGIFLTARIYPLFVNSELWFPVMTSFCFATMLLGAFLSLLSNDLKAILAYATVSQLGFFIGFYGMGGEKGVQFDFIHILNHAFYKGSLFMLVGIVDHATGIRDIRDLGGLWKKMPLTALIFFIAAAAMAGIPGSTGFLSKELFLADVLAFGKQYSTGYVILLVVGFASLFKVAFSIRLFYHIFLKPKEEHEMQYFQPPSFLSLISPLLLSGAALYFGLVPSALEFITKAFYVSGLHSLTSVTGGLEEGGYLELLISFAILFFGTLLFLLAERTNWSWTGIPSLLRFDEIFFSLCKGLQSLANGITRWTLPLRPDDALLFYIGALIVLVGGWSSQHFLALMQQKTWTATAAIEPVPALLIGASFLTIVSAGTILYLGSGIGEVIALSTTGFFITLYFVLYQAPDLAMTQLLVEVATIFILLFFMKSVPEKIFRWRTPSFRDRTKRWIALAAGIWAAFLCALTSLEPLQERLGDYFLRQSVPHARGTNAVNTILIDFRGLDTFGEVTVLLLAILGVVGLWKAKEWKVHSLPEDSRMRG